MNGAYFVRVDPKGKFVYVASRWNNSISSFARDSLSGKPTFGGVIKNITGLKGAKWITIDPTGAQVYVASTGDNAISWYEVDYLTDIDQNHQNSKKPLSCIAQTDFNNHNGTISYTLNSVTNKNVNIFVTSLQGKMIRSLFCGRQKPGVHTYQWNIGSNAEFPLASGMYLLNISIDNTVYGSYRISTK
jgi:DNA-binding beta-propeller fold protein YncE